MNASPPIRTAFWLLILSLASGACDGGTDLVAGPQTDPGTSQSEITRSVAFSTTSEGRGIPFGISELWRGSTILSDPGSFGASDNYTDAVTVVRQIDLARAAKHKLILNMTGGGHERYKTGGKFDLAKWKAAMNTYDSPVIKAAVLSGVADGTVILNSVIDEPNVADWGGVLTKPLLDEMALYVKRLFPTLPVAVTVRYDWRLHEHYRVVDAILTNYKWMRGDVIAYRDAALAMAKQDGIAIGFSLNVLDGGIINWTKKDCPIGPTAGYGTYSPTCRMTANQIREWGRELGKVGCAMTLWRYNSEFMAKADNQQAFRDLAATLADVPAKPCRRTTPGAPQPANSRPTAAFSEPRCVMGAACQFADGSSDSDGRIGLWRWDFGNGTTSTETKPSITYASDGVYSVSLTVTDDAGDTDVVTKNVTVNPLAIPTPTAGFSLRQCTVNATCGFTDASASPTGAIVNWSWDFGDGTTSTDPNPAHTFTAVGTYNVTLEVADAGGHTGAVTQSVIVSATSNRPPTAGFAVPNCAVSAPCQFADGSSDADGSIATRKWNLGNGTTSTETAPTIIYTTAGSYAVTLTVIDDAGDSSAVTRSVTVSPLPNRIPVAAFVAPSCIAGVACQLTDGSSDPDGTIVTRRWQLGNGSGSTLRNPSVTYAATRSYSVTLTVTDNTGATASVTRMVYVGAPRPSSTPITLNLSGSVNQNRQYVMLTWSGLSGSSVGIYRDGARLSTTPNDGRQNTIIPLQGTAATYTYKVCETGKTRCSASVSFKLPSILLNVTARTSAPGLQVVALAWTGGIFGRVDVYRNGGRIASPSNTGRYSETRRISGQGTNSYKVCAAGTSSCSNTVTARLP